MIKFIDIDGYDTPSQSEAFVVNEKSVLLHMEMEEFEDY